MANDSVWNERGEAVIRRDGTIVRCDSNEGRVVLRRTYGRNADTVERTGDIYDRDGGFYLD